MPPDLPTPVPLVSLVRDNVPRQIVVTQTLTAGGQVTTAVVTLGNGGPTLPAAPPTSTDNTSHSNGLSSTDIGIIVGSVVGATVLIILVWVSCVLRQRMVEAQDDGSSQGTVTTSMMEEETRRTRRFYHPWRFPRSIPPPITPQYRARSPPVEWTANDVGRHATTSYIIYDDNRRHR
ncbi:hypothetical protein F5Y18DRAFT_256696 [Xylariaceae sp. FL1019]|nr:hypothetical protein F5Y18DRAFT_256696 [Xylariaceae sp. FL1019]